MTHHATTAPSTSSATVTPSMGGPAVGKSKLAKYAIILGSFLLLVVALWVLYGKIQRKTPKNYRLSDISYGQVLTFEIKPGRSVKVLLTNDYCPVWSSDQLDTKDYEGTTRGLSGPIFTTGPGNGRSATVTFTNTNVKSITVKIGRCKSKKDCNIKF